MKSFLLDKRLATNTDYKSESDTAYIITEIGTDDTAKVTAKVEGVPCGEFITDIAPLITKSTNRLPLFDLGDLYIVIPPDKTYRFEGTSSKYVRIKGHILRFAPGETLPASHLSRYTEQGKKFWSYQADSLDSTVSVGADAATDVLSFTCPTGEKWLFNNYIMSKLLVAGAIDYDITTRIRLQDEPFDNLLNSDTKVGLTQYETPYPPNDTDGVHIGTLKDKQIEVKPGQVLKLQAHNTSSGAKSVQGESKVLIVGQKEYL
jgi:hypothetical protein